MKIEIINPELVHIVGNLFDNPNEMAPLRKKLLYTIWVLSKQESFLATGDRFNLAVSTGQAIFKQIIMALASLMPQLVIWPEENSYEALSAIFQNKTHGFSGILCAIDGCHIPCKQPIANKVDYYNRKGFHSIILQGTCDHRGRFIDIYNILVVLEGCMMQEFLEIALCLNLLQRGI
ncbi:putative nuclease HARBI1 isoform X1 [Anoplophora glabripennis]|uniref:putative nuclease HARBI1 isoform X1 n=1 Tax=Anoplophora glabripennis TaxID=217634 RepID=UPI0008743EB1|nr:putative nuclease HARBI1 isoform X1 [Anoplophora glabripennis]